jgi:hypothetical protein
MHDDDEQPEGVEDVALEPGAYSDASDELARAISPDILERDEVHSYRNAATILRHSEPEALDELEDALRRFSVTMRDIGMPGGNESVIPKKVSRFLRPAGWHEVRIQGDLLIRLKKNSVETTEAGKKRRTPLPDESFTLDNYIDGHQIDYVKGKVAFDLEWNSKDQTFDRDLYAFRLFYDCGVINAAVLMTRSAELNEVIAATPKLGKNGQPELGPTGEPVSCKAKYGASTTWMGKLLYRLNAGRNGGCPVLVFGITPQAVQDWPQRERG